MAFTPRGRGGGDRGGFRGRGGGAPRGGRGGGRGTAGDRIQDNCDAANAFKVGSAIVAVGAVREEDEEHPEEHHEADVEEHGAGEEVPKEGRRR